MNNSKFWLFVLLLWANCCISLMAQPKLRLEDFALGFTRPVEIVHCGDSRLFVVEQRGRILILDSLGKQLPAPFLDIDPRVNSNGNEQGLLGLAFHPNYKQNGFFFVYYTDNSGDTQVSRFSVDAMNPNLADPNSEVKILWADQPFNNHNGGCIHFGPDGYLYISIGDGGSAGDPQNNGQKKNTFLGKILRIDVDGGSPYRVPADNPFVGDPTYSPEIWATGLRNVWKFSFDATTGDLWMGDVGQNAREEIDFLPAGVGGKNFGWRCYEGTIAYNTNGCQAAATYERPVFEYANPSIGCSVTGGYVYRGQKYPELSGTYLFADYCSGRIWQTRRRTDGTFATQQLADLANYEFSSFGQDHLGELYLALLGSGKIVKITELCSNFNISGKILDETCAGTSDGNIQLTIENAAGTPTIVWNTGSTDAMLGGISAGKYTVSVTDANGCLRVDSFLVKNATPATPTLIANNTSFCTGDTVELTASPRPLGYQYEWLRDGQVIFVSDFSTLKITQAGKYQVKLEGTPCPSAPSDTLTIQMLPLPQPQILQISDTLKVNISAEKYQWLLDGVPVAGAEDHFWKVLKTGNYSVRVFDGKCWGESEAVFVVVLDATALPADVLDLQLLPNPTKQLLFFEMNLKNNGQTTLRLTDAQQRTLQFFEVTGSQIAHVFDLSQLPAGTYFLQVQTPAGWLVRRVIRL